MKFPRVNISLETLKWLNIFAGLQTMATFITMAADIDYIQSLGNFKSYESDFKFSVVSSIL